MPASVSLALTPVFLLLGTASGGGGHGDYFLAKLLFPLSMFSTLFLGSITWPFIVLAVVQYPAYGVVLGLANKNNRLMRASGILFSIHALLASLCLIAPNSNF